MVTDVNPEQPKKAFSPILFTEFGIVTSVIHEPFKKLLGSDSTSSPIITCPMLLVGPPSYSSIYMAPQFLAFQIKEEILLHPQKA